MLCTWFITSSTLCGLTMIHWWIICLGFRGKAFGAESLGVHTTRHSGTSYGPSSPKWYTWFVDNLFGDSDSMNMCEVYGMTMNDMGVPDTPTLSLFEIFQITNLGWLFGLLWFWWIHPAPVAVPVSYAVEQRKEMFAPIAVNCQMYAVRHSENFKMGLEQITPRLCRDWWFLVRLVNPLIGFQLWY